MWPINRPTATLMVGSIGLHAAYGVYSKLAYDPAKDLRVVTVLAEMPHVVVATPSLAASNLAELTALAKRRLARSTSARPAWARRCT